MKKLVFLVFALQIVAGSWSCRRTAPEPSTDGQPPDRPDADGKTNDTSLQPTEKEVDWTTDYERSKGTTTPRYADTLAYCQRLAEHSPMVEFTHFGTSPQGRPLPLVIVDRRGNFEPAAVRTSGNAVIMIQAAIHAGEVSGKDAGMMLIRDMAVTGELAFLLEHVTVLFIPIFNTDGHERFGPHGRINQNGPKEMGWRTNAQNLNLNRDFLKADTMEMQAWLKLFTAWLPDFFVDTHATDGADYQYPITYGLERYDNTDQGLAAWNTTYLETIEKLMTESGFPLSPYVAFKRWHDPRSGLVAYASSPRYSHGYAAVQNRPGLLIETHMLKDYATRVTATYEMLKHTLRILNDDHVALTQLVRQADQRTAAPEFREQSFPLKFKTTEHHEPLAFKGVKYEVVKSDLTGGQWFQYSDQPETFTIPYYNKIVPTVTVKLPLAYIIPPQWHEVIDRLALHGVSIQRLKKTGAIKVRSYRFSNIKWEAEESWHTLPYEGRHLCSFDTETVEQKRSFPNGSALIRLNQRTARIIAHALEPQGPDSFVHWGYFNPMFQRTEYVESYVIEALAREMLDKDPELAKAFAEAKQQSPKLAKNPAAIRQWFYQRTPYYDQQLNLYPVGLIDDEGTLVKLMAMGSTTRSTE